MGSLIDELQRREAAAREEAEELRGQIAQLTERLAGVEVRLSRLVITRETVDEVLNGSGAEAAPAAVMPDGAVASRSGHLSAAGMLAVPPWRAGLPRQRAVGGQRQREDGASVDKGPFTSPLSAGLDALAQAQPETLNPPAAHPARDSAYLQIVLLCAAMTATSLCSRSRA
jgi:hypothetical protein